MARAIWKGSIAFGLVQIPVELFVAEEPNELSFRQLDKHDFAPIGYDRINKRTGKKVALVDAGEVDPIFFERPYYVAPTKQGTKAYALLRETLAKNGQIGIAKVVIRTRQHLAALMPHCLL